MVVDGHTDQLKFSTIPGDVLVVLRNIISRNRNPFSR